MISLTDTIRALMIDDDEDDFILTRAQLALLLRPRIELEWVSSFQEGLDAMRSNRYDVYLVDYRLGAENGLDLIRSVIALGCKKPIIMLTGVGDREIDEEALAAGVTDYLVKGEISSSLLERTIRYAIQRKQIEGELTEMQQRLADSREEQRLHLARELHDGPLQDLIGIRFHLGVIVRALDNPDFAQQLAPIQDQLQGAVDSLRAICGELRPPSLAPFGLEQALRAHARQFQEEHPEIAVQLDLDADRQLLPERVRLALYRIYQHALSNVTKHARATQVRVGFTLTEDQVNLKIVDDGCGFEVPPRWIDLARQGHYGLLGSSERAESIGGQLRVVSSVEQGTIVSVTAPRPRPVGFVVSVPLHTQEDGL
jgi:signal transduction histidine kinase